jgi:hypothetical protein
MHGGDHCLLVISPFIGLAALTKFLESAGCLDGIKVVVRWRPEDLCSGVSDIEVYPYLAERQIPLYINQDIHLKLYVFESNTAFSTSANLTLTGFGYSDKPNIETGSFVHLTDYDWARLYLLIERSRQVDNEMYLRCRRFVEECPKVPQKPHSASGLFGSPKTYTISSLPAMESPAALAEYYFRGETGLTADDIRRAVHDLVVFEVPSGLEPFAFDQHLGQAFRHSPFVTEFVGVLKAAKSLRFGAVNDWIHRTCEDVPLPYRWELKDNTRIFYNWLEYFFAEISWQRPGYSQIISWRDHEAGIDPDVDA